MESKLKSVLVIWFLYSTIAIQVIGFNTPEKFTSETRKMLQLWKRKIDMNVGFQLRKLGIVHGRSAFNNATKCYGPLGCVEINEDWYGITRPVNDLPQEREIVNTQFHLYTKNAPGESFPLNISDHSSISEAGFDPSKPTKVIIHGFIDTGHVPWVKELVLALLKMGDFNVIAVDWGGGSAVMYSQAAANTRLVGLEVAFVIEYLIANHGAHVEDFHLIGHSLGSHISGYAGERLKHRGQGLLGRISGLDPAEPLFQSMPEFVRLDPDDAEFVDVIHTDAKSILMFGYGMEQPVGHVDFYPNGGTDQPGCSLLDLPVSMNSMVDPDRTADSVSRHLVACSHTRAINLYIESLNQDQSCFMVGHECPSYEEFQMGLCFSCGSQTQHCAPMGYRAIEYKHIVQAYERRNVKFYLETNKGPESFCQYHYLLELNLAQPSIAERWVQGFLKVNLYGSKSEILDNSLTPEESLRFVHGHEKNFLMSFPQDLGDVRIVNLHWEYDHELDPLNLTKVCVLLCSDHIYVRNITVAKVHTSQVNLVEGIKLPLRDDRTIICGDSKEKFADIQSGEWKLFYKPCITGPAGPTPLTSF
ncbi:pancreatic lipase-related protein 2-like isoform X1 [Tigriopus californicus]|uniref:pancreatic lipase-related protein 2-like isoform X1 n=1 Tax=Tigriopus californicus TaxID=6832 RepID=UPI0027DA4E87|nr:pancreatic lipase-related protein 2-like isoform X1 [Tigriopus californicus]